MTTPQPCPRLAFWLLLLLFGELLCHATTSHVIQTWGGSEKEVVLPDEQVVSLLYWMDEAGTQQNDTTTTVSEREGDYEQEEQEEEQEEEEDGHSDDTTTTPLVPGGGNSSVSLDEGTVSITYFVSSLQYPPLDFPVAERGVWLSVHFHHDRVFIPAARLSRNPLPPSWWGRRVKVSSGSRVYWYLCRSAYECAPGNPLHLFQNTNASLPRLEKTLVMVFGTLCGALLLLCLGLVALVLHLRRRPRHSHPVSSLDHANTISAHQFSINL